MIVLELMEFTRDQRSAFEDLLRETWRQTWDDELGRQIIQWRYYDRPGDALTLVAVENGRCVAMLDSVLRPYMLDGKRIQVRETADWYCRPSHRVGGLGLRLQWLLEKKCPEPIFVLGGSQFTVDILSSLGWPVPACASSYILPIKARGLAGNLIRQRWSKREALARFIPESLPVRRPKRVRPPAGKRADIKTLAPNDAVPLISAATTALTPLLETAHWQWLAKIPPALAVPVGILFRLDDIPVGVTYCQMEPAASGLDAKIVHVQCADATVCAWVMSATTEILAEHGAGFVRCYVSSREKITAAEQVGFIKSKDVPCYWLPRAGSMPAAVDVSYLRGDDAIPFQALRGRVGSHHVR